MSLNPFTNYSWNYTDNTKAGYTDTIIGTVFTLQEIQKRSYNPNGGPGAPEWWQNADGTLAPKMNIRIGLVTPEGQFVAFTFQPAGKEAKAGKKKSIHMDLYHLSGNNMMNLIGKTISISTITYDENGNKIIYGRGNPRPFNVTIVDSGPYEPKVQIPAEYKVPELLCDNSASGGQTVPPQNIQAPQAQTYQQTYVQPQPQAQPVMQQQAQWTQQRQQPVMGVQQAQPVQQQIPISQQVTAPQQMPDGMDPQLANAMQNVGAQNVTAYDEDIPF